MKTVLILAVLLFFVACASTGKKTARNDDWPWRSSKKTKQTTESDTCFQKTENVYMIL